MLGLLAATLLVLVLATPLAAQVRFQRTYNRVYDDYGYSVAQTADGGYIITGNTGTGGGDTDVWLIKTDASGNTMWTRTYGGPDADKGQSVAQTPDGGYIIAGETESFGPGGCCVWLIKTDASGDTMWTRTYGGGDWDEGSSVALTADGGYIITGTTRSFGPGWFDVYLIKTDASGDTMWTRAYGGPDADKGQSVAQTADGGYVIAGYTECFGAGGYDAWLIKTDASGDTIWTHTYGEMCHDFGYSVALTADSGYVVAGHTQTSGQGRVGFWLIKTDASGDTIWTRTYGGPDDEGAQSVAQTADGGYVIAGYTWSFGAGDRDVWVVKTDASGDTVWTRTYGGTDGDYGRSVAQTADGGYVITGNTASFGAGGIDVYLIKTDANGSPAVAEPEPPVAYKPIGATLVRGMLEISSQLTAGSLRPGIELYDADGRRVAVLHPGENDVRHLSPGVYFIRGEGSRIQGSKGPSRKVILTR